MHKISIRFIIIIFIPTNILLAKIFTVIIEILFLMLLLCFKSLHDL